MENLVKDSVGNDLPQSVRLNSGATIEQIGKAQTINSFNLAAAISLEKGKIVIYNKDEKTATITDEQGFSSFIMHL